MLINIDKKEQVSKYLLEKYVATISYDQIAHELKVGSPALKNYDLTSLKQLYGGKKPIYSTISFVEFVQANSVIVKNGIDKINKQYYFQILNYLKLRFDRLMIDKNEYIELINNHIQLDRLNDLIKQKRGLPKYFKYKSFRFTIVEIAYFLSSVDWFKLPRSDIDINVSFDTVRFYIQNFQNKGLILDSFKGHGYKWDDDRDKEEKSYSKDIYYEDENKYRTTICRSTFVKPSKKNFAATSLEFYGLNTYVDYKDKNRSGGIGIFSLIVNDNGLENLTYITKIDVAVDIPTALKNIKLFKNERCIDFNDNSKSYYKGYNDSLPELIDRFPNIKIISSKNLLDDIKNRFFNNTPYSFEKIWFKNLQEFNHVPTMKSLEFKWLEYDYDIIYHNEKFKVKQTIFAGDEERINSLKLHRVENDVIGYDKYKKSNKSKNSSLEQTTTRIEFRLVFKGIDKISWNEFYNKDILTNKILSKLEKYSFYIHAKLVSIKDLIHIDICNKYKT